MYLGLGLDRFDLLLRMRDSHIAFLLQTIVLISARRIQTTSWRFKVISHQVLSWEIFPPRTALAVYCRQPWRLVYVRHFNIPQETDWESGDANEISPPTTPILHSEWLLSSPRSYKSDRVRERRRTERGWGREGQRKMEWRRKKEKQFLWPNCPLQGRHGDWVAVRRTGLREIRKHNVQCMSFSAKTRFWLERFSSPFPS